MQPHTQSVRSHTNDGNDRLQRRRVRRMKRRARILAPFLGVPLLLATLALSVDLVEYQPTEEPDRLSDRPIQMQPIKEAPKRSDRPSFVSSIPATSQSSVSDQNRHATGDPLNRLELGLNAADAPKSPTPPAVLRRH